MPDTAATFMTHNPQVSQLLILGIGFLFSALTGIIIWLAKGLMKKIDNNSENFRQMALNVANLSKDFSALLKDFGEFKERLRDLETVKAKLQLVEQDLHNLKQDFHSMRALQESRDNLITDLRLAIVKYERKLFFNEKARDKEEDK